MRIDLEPFGAATVHFGRRGTQLAQWRLNSILVPKFPPDAILDFHPWVQIWRLGIEMVDQCFKSPIVLTWQKSEIETDRLFGIRFRYFVSEVMDLIAGRWCIQNRE